MIFINENACRRQPDVMGLSARFYSVKPTDECNGAMVAKSAGPPWVWGWSDLRSRIGSDLDVECTSGFKKPHLKLDSKFPSNLWSPNLVGTHDWRNLAVSAGTSYTYHLLYVVTQEFSFGKIVIIQLAVILEMAQSIPSTSVEQKLYHACACICVNMH